jgi:CrcB protein
MMVLVLSPIVYLAAFPPFFLLSPDYRSKATAALLFAYPGALTRHLLGSVLNSKIPSFPLGTFGSNTMGTIVSALAYVFQNLPQDHCNGTKDAMLQGLVDGYAGCLSTVSTFIAEMHLLNRRHAWTYVLTSWIIAQVFLILIIGSTYWARGLDISKTC